jgi:hypothetical protein
MEACPTACLPLYVSSKGNLDPSPALFLLALEARELGANHNRALQDPPPSLLRPGESTEARVSDMAAAPNTFPWTLYCREKVVANGTHKCSSQEDPDEGFLGVLRQALKEFYQMNGMVDSGDDEFCTDRFKIRKKFWYDDPTKKLEITATPKEVKARTFRLFPVHGYGRKFWTLSPSGVLDVFRGIDRVCKPENATRTEIERASREWVSSVLAKGGVKLEGLQLANTVPKLWRVTAQVLGTHAENCDSWDTVFADGDGAKRATLQMREAFLSVLPQPHFKVAQWLKENPRGRIRALQTNGLESRLLYKILPSSSADSGAAPTDFWKSGAGRRDEERCNNQEKLVSAKSGAVHPEFVGHIAVDMGMSDVQALFVPEAHSTRVIKACDSEDAAEPMMEDDNAPDLMDPPNLTAFPSMRITRDQVDAEANTRYFQHQQADSKRTVLEGLAPQDLEDLNKVGGMDGDIAWDMVCLDNNLRARVLSNMKWLQFRTGHYTGLVYAEQRFQRRRALQSLANRLVKWTVQVARGGSVTRTLPSKKERLRVAKADDPWVHVSIAWGAWNGLAPPQYRGNNSMPRRELLRRVLTGVRQYTMNGQCEKTKVVVGVNLQNEDRSSLQCCAGRHYKTEERINRVSPVQGEHSRYLHHNKPWKLLWCPSCKVILQRDRSAAYNIAIKAAWKRLHTLGKATKESPKCLERWRR